MIVKPSGFIPDVVQFYYITTGHALAAFCHVAVHKRLKYSR